MPPQDNDALIAQFAANFDPEKNLIRYDADGRCRIAQHSLPYAIALLQRNAAGDHDRAIAIISAVLDTQMHSPPAPSWDQGRFPFILPETWRDLNANLFMTPHLVELHTQWRDKLPPQLATRLDQALRDAVYIVERRWADELFDPHRDFTAYSNIFALYILALWLLGDCLAEPRLEHDALAQWRRWFNHVSIYGIDEFNSPGYNHVVYEALLRIRAVVTDESVLKEVALVLDHLSGLQHAVNHPLLRVQAVGTSRDYRAFVPPGQGEFHFLAPPESSEHSGDERYTPPAAVLEEFRNRKYPFRAHGRAGLTPFRFQTWQMPHAAMGTMTGGNYFPQQIHLMAAVGDSPVQRACAFFNADPANAIQGYTRQQDGRALCLFARTVTPYHRYQLRKPAKTLETLPPSLGLTQGWQVEHDPEAHPGQLKATAYGHTLHVQAFALQDSTLTPMPLTPQTLNEGKDTAVQAWRADDSAVWTAFLVQLLPQGQTPAPVKLTGSVGEREIHLQESGGLALKIARRPSGELVEQYPDDWRIAPLFASPAHTLHAGDLIAASVDTPPGSTES